MPLRPLLIASPATPAAWVWSAMIRNTPSAMTRIPRISSRICALDSCRSSSFSTAFCTSGDASVFFFDEERVDAFDFAFAFVFLFLLPGGLPGPLFFSAITTSLRSQQ